MKTLDGKISLTPSRDGVRTLTNVNLNNGPDSVQYPAGRPDASKPKSGIDDQIGMNYKWRNAHANSTTSLKLALNWTETFHELAEAYAKVDLGMEYLDAHKYAIDREVKLRDQRPYLKDYNPGSGPGPNFTITVIRRR